LIITPLDYMIICTGIIKAERSCHKSNLDLEVLSITKCVRQGKCLGYEDGFVNI
jgi:hypothetical protein